jgi:hypothetical protein
LAATTPEAMVPSIPSPLFLFLLAILSLCMYHDYIVAVGRVPRPLNTMYRTVEVNQLHYKLQQLFTSKSKKDIKDKKFVLIMAIPPPSLLVV